MSSEPPPPNVTVKLKRGSWEIEITSPADKVQQAVESVIAGMASKEETTLASPEATLEADGEKRFETCRGVLQKMWKEGWFASERSLSEVDEEMAQTGIPLRPDCRLACTGRPGARRDPLQGRGDEELQICAEVSV